MKIFARGAFFFSLFSISLWAFTGVPLWSSVGDDIGRGYILVILHVSALFWGAASFANDK